MVAATHAEVFALPDAIERLAFAAERAAAARIDLAVATAAATAKTLATSAVVVSFALLIGGLAWLCLMAGALVVLAERTSTGGALLLIGGVQAVVATTMVLATRGTLAAPLPVVGARR